MIDDAQTAEAKSLGYFRASVNGCVVYAKSISPIRYVRLGPEGWRACTSTFRSPPMASFCAAAAYAELHNWGQP